MQKREPKFSRGRNLKMEMTIERNFFQEHKEALGRHSGEHRMEVKPIL